jgi:hypothetical protein
MQINYSLKGTYYRYDEELVIPIIENTPFEEDLQVYINILFNIIS